MKTDEAAMGKYWKKVKNQVLRLLRSKTKPVRTGEIALETRLSLKETEALMVVMEDEGSVRNLDEIECAQHKDMHPGHSFVLRDPSSVPPGDLE